MAKKFNIQIRTSHPQMWRYNVAISCGCLDSSGATQQVVGEEQTVASVGSNLRSAPEGYSLPYEFHLSTPACEGIIAYIYLIPHSLPAERDIAQCEPFSLRVKVQADKDTIYNMVHKVNQWAGTSIELKF